MGDADVPRGRSQADGTEAVALDQPPDGLEERAGQVPVVVPIVRAHVSRILT
jgi:hypothetical protein